MRLFLQHERHRTKGRRGEVNDPAARQGVGVYCPGKTYYLLLDMPSRWFAFHARPRLVLISEEEGRKLLGKRRLVRQENDDYPLPPSGCKSIF